MVDSIDGIAIVGIACKLPGAKNKEEYWKNLVEEKETLKHFSDEELRANEFNVESLLNNPNYVRVRGVLDDIDKWDANFFNVIPRDAKEMDPQQRLWLETTWEAFEDAGCDPFKYKGVAGVFAGSFYNTYLMNNLLREPGAYDLYIRGRTPEMFQTYINSDPMFLATRTAYFYNLKGPAINIQTACSTSLVAICQACNSLMSYETDLCLAGGATVIVPQESGYLYQEGAISSPDGHCKPFDISSKGAVFGNGVGVVVLKRIQDAIKDNDHVYAVIKGWATNNDGNEKIGFTAPGIEGQSKVIAAAHSFANIKAEDIRYVEAHGTGTPLGDPIEVAALTKAFRKTTDKKQYCGLGSVKSNIGHLDAAAGVAGLIKIALATHKRQVPATLHFTAPNPMLNIESTPFFIQSKPENFDIKEPLLMGVSSFGIGGTNAHVVIGEAPIIEQGNKSSKNINPELIVLSAKTETALQLRKKQLIEYLQEKPDLKLSDIAYTLQSGRRHMEYRACFAVDSIENINVLFPLLFEAKSEPLIHALVFAFPGQGSQYTGMGKQLYKSSSIFRSHLDLCFDIFKAETGTSLEDIIFADGDQTEVGLKLSQTRFTQAALFSIEYALAKLYASLGIEPTVMIGHSIGEYAAACIAGVFDLSSALRIVIKRGELMQSMPSGQMMAVNCSKEKLNEINSNLFEIAADNAQESCTISFPVENAEPIKELLAAKAIIYSLLNTSHAFHSSSFDPILEKFKNFVNQFPRSSPKIPFISCLTGEFITTEQACSGDYWAMQLRHTVHFAEGISSIVKNNRALFLEVGPNTHLSSLIRRSQVVVNKKHVINSLGKSDGKNEFVRIVQSTGELWVNGFSLKFENVRSNNESVRKLSLPTYPWEKKRYWVDVDPIKVHANQGNNISNNFQDRDELKETSNDTLTNDKNLTKTEKDLLRIWTKAIGSDDIKITDNFSELGGYSLLAVQILSKIKETIHISIPLAKFLDNPTICDLGRIIDSEKKDTSVAPEKKEVKNLVFINKTGTKTPFILIHGGNTANFLPRYLNGERPILHFLDLGSDGERYPYNNIEDLSYFYVQQIKTLVPKGPYLLGGFSFGGLVASKVAEILQKEYNDTVPCIVLLDTKTPQVEYPEAPHGRLRNLARVKENKVVFIIGAMGRRMRSYIRRVKKIKYYKLYLLLNIPIPINLRSQHIFAEYMKMSQKYVPAKVESDMLLIKSNENPIEDLNLGWDGLMNNIETISVDGSHVDIILIEKNYKIIGERIVSFIDKLENSK